MKSIAHVNICRLVFPLIMLANSACGSSLTPQQRAALGNAIIHTIQLFNAHDSDYANCITTTLTLGYDLASPTPTPHEWGRIIHDCAELGVLVYSSNEETSSSPSSMQRQLAKILAIAESMLRFTKTMPLSDHNHYQELHNVAISILHYLDRLLTSTSTHQQRIEVLFMLYTCIAALYQHHHITHTETPSEPSIAPDEIIVFSEQSSRHQDSWIPAFAAWRAALSDARALHDDQPSISLPHNDDTRAEAIAPSPTAPPHNSSPSMHDVHVFINIHDQHPDCTTQSHHETPPQHHTTNTKKCRRSRKKT